MTVTPWGRSTPSRRPTRGRWQSRAHTPDCPSGPTVPSPPPLPTIRKMSPDCSLLEIVLACQARLLKGRCSEPWRAAATLAVRKPRGSTLVDKHVVRSQPRNGTSSCRLPRISVRIAVERGCCVVNQEIVDTRPEIEPQMVGAFVVRRTRNPPRSGRCPRCPWKSPPHSKCPPPVRIGRVGLR